MSYVLMKNGLALVTVIRENPALVAKFVDRHHPEHSVAKDVLVDLLCEAGAERLEDGSKKSWRAAKKKRDETGWSLFWVGACLIRQSIIRDGTGRWSRTRGWREVPETMKLRRAAEKREEQRRRFFSHTADDLDRVARPA